MAGSHSVCIISGDPFTMLHTRPPGPATSTLMRCSAGTNSLRCRMWYSSAPSTPDPPADGRPPSRTTASAPAAATLPPGLMGLVKPPPPGLVAPPSAAVCGSSIPAPQKANVCSSSGSPDSSPFTYVRLWQVAMRRSMSAAVPAAARDAGVKRPAAAPRTHCISRPSVVSVPVLSKQKQFTLPARLTRGGEMQVMRSLRSASSAYAMPMVSASGRAGGTTMVIMSQPRCTILPASAPKEDSA